MAGIGDIMLALAGGGLLGSVLGGQQSSTTSTATQQATLPPAMQAAIDSALGRATQLSSEPFIPYGAPRIANFTPEQVAAMNYGIGQSGGGQELLDVGASRIAGINGTPTTGQIAGLMNPYDSLVTENLIRELDRRNAMAGIASNQALVRTGAFGGGRQGVIDSTRAREHERLISDTLASQGAASYDKAINQFNTGNTMSLNSGSALGQLGQARPQVVQNEFQNLYGIGALGQGQNQANLDLAYQDFLEQRQYPFQQLGFLSNIISGTPNAQSSTTTSSTPAPGMLQQLSGIGLGIAGLLNQRNSSNSISATR